MDFEGLQMMLGQRDKLGRLMVYRLACYPVGFLTD